MRTRTIKVDDVPKLPSKFTKQQLKILGLIGDGLATKEIATKMNISPKGVEYHRNQIYQKLNTTRMAQLIRTAFAFGLTSLCAMFLCSAAAAQSFLVVSNPAPAVQLAWTPPVGSPGITGYKVYVGVGSQQYTNATEVGLVTNVSITLPARGVQYFFAVTTHTALLESPFSNEVTYTPPNPPAAPSMKPLTVISVLKSSKPNGLYADAGMNWSESPDQPETYYKLKIDKGVILSLVAPLVPR